MKNLSPPASNDSLLQAFKPRNYKKLSNEVLTKLKEAFKTNHYPNKKSLEELAQELQETAHRIESWFRTERKRQFRAGSLRSKVCFLLIYFANFLIRKDITSPKIKFSSFGKNLKSVTIELQNNSKICTYSEINSDIFLIK